MTVVFQFLDQLVHVFEMHDLGRHMAFDLHAQPFNRLYELLNFGFSVRHEPGNRERKKMFRLLPAIEFAGFLIAGFFLRAGALAVAANAPDQTAKE